MADPILPPPHGGAVTPAPADSLASIDQRLSAIERSEERRAGAAKTLTTMWAIFGVVITSGAIAFGTWVWTIQGDVSDLAHATVRNAERLQEHASRGGPLGHPDSVIARTAVNEGRIGALESSVQRIDERLGDIDRKVDELLERMPRRSR